MSEEINEDNCVLSDNELMLVGKGLLFYSTFIKKENELYEKYENQLFQKIKKLNEMAKQVKEKQQ